MMFIAYNKEVLAKMLAFQHNLNYGNSILDGNFYVGTEEELTIAGVTDIQAPR